MTVGDGVEDPIAVVTGASRGIGRAVAVELARRGHRVLATMRDPGAGSRLRDDAGPASNRIEIMALDVTDPGEFTFPDATAILVDNAGGMEHDLPFEATSLEEWRRIFEVNVFGTVELTRRVIPVMRARGVVWCATSRPPPSCSHPPGCPRTAEMALANTEGFEALHRFITSPDDAAAKIVDALFDPDGPMRRACDPVAGAALKRWRQSSDEDQFAR